MNNKKQLIARISVALLLLIAIFGILKWRDFVKTSIVSKEANPKYANSYSDDFPSFDPADMLDGDIYVNKSVFAMEDDANGNMFFISLTSSAKYLQDGVTSPISGGITFEDTLGLQTSFAGFDGLYGNGDSYTDFIETAGTDSTVYTLTEFPGLTITVYDDIDGEGNDSVVWYIPEAFTTTNFELTYMVSVPEIRKWDLAPMLNPNTRSGMIESNQLCTATYDLRDSSTYVEINEPKDDWDDSIFWENNDDYEKVDYVRQSELSGDTVTVYLGNRGRFFSYGTFKVTTVYSGFDTNVPNFSEEYEYGADYCANDSPDILSTQPDTYELSSVVNSDGTDNVCGFIEGEDITVTLTYTSLGAGKYHYTVRYMNGSNVEDSYTGLGEPNSQVCPENRTFYGYTYDHTTCYTLDTDNKVINIALSPAMFNVTTHHVDVDTGDDVATAVVQPWAYGSHYTTSAITVPEYDLDSVSGNYEGDVNGDVDVYYYYYYTGPSTGGDTATVTVNYVDESGTPIHSSLTETVASDSTACYNPITIDHYSFLRTEGDGACLTGNKTSYTITHIYKDDTPAVTPAVITVNYYENVEGNPVSIKTADTLNYNVGDTYTVTPPTIDNYEFNSTLSDSLTGEVTGTTLTVNLYYTRKTATFTINYVFLGESSNSTQLTFRYGEGYDVTSYRNTYTDYSLYNTEGDSLTGTIEKDTYTVTFYYMKRQVGITVNYVDMNYHSLRATETIQADYNANISDYIVDESSLPEITGYQYVRTEHNGGDTVGDNNTDIWYIYRLKESHILVHYVDEGGTSIDVDQEITKFYNDTYSISPKTIVGYVYKERTGDSDSGTISQDNYEITFVYKLREVVVTTHHYVSGTTTKVAQDDTQTKHYFESYTTSPKDTTNLDYNYASSDGDAENGTINKDSIVVIYYYTIKRGTVTVNHYLYDGGETTTEVAPAVSKTYDYNTTYNTESSSIALEDYDFYSRTTNYTGTVKAPTIVVNYYYQPKSTTITASVSQEGTEKITSEDAAITYTITYNVEVARYTGDADVVIVDTLPRPINESECNFDGGVYNENDNTISWTHTWTGIDTGRTPVSKTYTKSITIVYSDIVGTDRSIVNQVKGTIETTDASRETTSQFATAVEIKGVVNVQFLEKDTDEVLAPAVHHEDLVGELFITTPADVPGYEVVEGPDTEEYTIRKEEQTVTYYYEKINVRVETVVNGPGGKISGDEEFLWGEDSKEDNIVIEADDGYVIMDVFINGERIDIPINQTKWVLPRFEGMKENKRIEVSFHKGLIINPSTSSSLLRALLVFVGTALVLLAFIKREYLMGIVRRVKTSFGK